MDNALLAALSSYQELVNGNGRLRRLLQGWDRNLCICCKDTEQKFQVSFADSQVATVSIAEPNYDAYDISLEADNRELLDVFSGRKNPAQSYLRGSLHVYANDQDRVKLDAISLVLWGM